MKEFDLEKAKAGAPIVTKDGRNARIIGERKHPEYPLVVAVCDRNGVEEVFLYTNKGRNYLHQVCDEDLLMAPIIHKRYANFYFKDEDLYDLGEVYDSKDDAIRNIRYDVKYIKTIEIEWEE